MPLIASKKQISAVLHTTAVDALPATIGDAATSDTLVSAVEVDYDIERFDREFVRNTITRLKQLVGQKAINIALTFELLGDGTPHSAVPPRWSKFLQACGMKQVEIQTIAAIGAITGGPFRHGETITQATSGATATVIGDVHTGSTELFIEKPPAGAIAFDATNILTGGDTGATVTPTLVPADEGHAWYPITDVIKQMATTAAAWSATPAIGNVIEGQTSKARGIVQAGTTDTDDRIRFIPIRGTFTDGESVDDLTTPTVGFAVLETPTAEVYFQGPPIAIRAYEDGIASTIIGGRGTPTFTFEVNRPVRCRCEFRGVLQDVDDIPNISGIDYDYATPPLWVASGIGYADNEAAADEPLSAEQAPCFTTLELALGATVVDRKCADAAGGLLEAWITGREGTGSGDPEATLENDLGFVGSLESGDVFRLRLTVGAADGQLFTVQIPGGQHSGDNPSESDGKMTRDFNFDLTGGNINNINAGSPAGDINSIGGDNELVLIFHSGA